jgi:hypothetical protein
MSTITFGWPQGGAQLEKQNHFFSKKMGFEVLKSSEVSFSSRFIDYL